MSGARVVVVGGGFTGVTTARRLHAAGHQVVLVEASDRLGGQVRTVEFADRRIDVGAEAFHTGAPGVTPFLNELGLTDMVKAVRAGTWIATRDGLSRLPDGVGPAGPTRLRPVLESGMISPKGLARAGLEPMMARAVRLGEHQDVSVGRFLSTRFGREVTEVLVDPLLGGLHAGDVNRLSLRACTPMLVPAARRGSSLVARKKAPANPDAMSFVTAPGGLSAVLTRLLADGVGEIRLGTRVSALTSDDDGVRLTLEPTAANDGSGGDGCELRADAVVLAVPPPVAAGLLAPVPAAHWPLAASSAATVATVLVAFDHEAVRGVDALTGTGILVPSTHGRLLKAATFLSTKWEHLSGGPSYVMRLSAGRAGQNRVAAMNDDDLVTGMLADLAELTGLRAAPLETLVTRWVDTMPQLTVGHPARLVAARAALQEAGLPVALAGTGYDGVGLSTCISSAATAVDTVQGLLAAR